MTLHLTTSVPITTSTLTHATSTTPVTAMPVAGIDGFTAGAILAAYVTNIG